jgi:hypothetical protein
MGCRPRVSIIVRCLLGLAPVCCTHATALPAQQVGVLVLLGIRDGPAEVQVDGVRVGTLLDEPLELQVAPGRPHAVRVRKVGFEDFTADVTVTPGGAAEPIRVNLAERPVRAVVRPTIEAAGIEPPGELHVFDLDAHRVPVVLGDQAFETPITLAFPRRGAEVRIGGTQLCLVPTGPSPVVRMRAGRIEDLRDASRCEEVRPRMELAQAPAGASLLIDGSPPQALDATPLGPLFELPQAGMHVALVTASGYPDVSFEFEVSDGELITAELAYAGYPDLLSDTVLLPVPPRPSLQAEPRPLAPSPPLSPEERQALRSELAMAARSRPTRSVLQLGGILAATLGVAGLAEGLTSHSKTCGVDYWAGPTYTCRLKRDEPSAVLYAASAGLVAAGIVMTIRGRGRPLPAVCGSEGKDRCVERLSATVDAAEADSAAYPQRASQWEADSLAWERRNQETLTRYEADALPAWRATVAELAQRNAVQHANLQRNTTALQEWLEKVRRGELTPAVRITRRQR